MEEGIRRINGNGKIFFRSYASVKEGKKNNTVLYLFLYVDIKIQQINYEDFKKTVNQMITQITSVKRKTEEIIWNIPSFSRMYLSIICVFTFFIE